TTSSGLSTLRPEGTVPDVDVQDVFGGVTERLVLTERDLLTIRVGIASHDMTLAATGSGDAVLTPDGWQQNWFSKVDASGSREVASAVWERAGVAAWGSHDFSVSGSVHHRSMHATLVDQPIRIMDEAGALVRMIQFGRAGALNPVETYEGIGLRDVWDLSRRLQVDAGLRFDGGASSQAVTLGPRLGVRYQLSDDGRTTLRFSAGRYVGRVPLAAEAFRQFPARIDSTFDP